MFIGHLNALLSNSSSRFCPVFFWVFCLFLLSCKSILYSPGTVPFWIFTNISSTLQLAFSVLHGVFLLFLISVLSNLLFISLMLSFFFPSLLPEHENILLYYFLETILSFRFRTSVYLELICVYGVRQGIIFYFFPYDYYISKWQDVLCSCKMTQYCKIWTVSKLIYILSAIPVKTPAGFFVETGNLISKFIQKCIRPKIIKSSLKKNNLGRCILLDTKIHYKGTVMKTRQYRHKGRQTDQWNEREFRNRHIYTVIQFMSVNCRAVEKGQSLKIP